MCVSGNYSQMFASGDNNRLKAPQTLLSVDIS